MHTRARVDTISCLLQQVVYLHKARTKFMLNGSVDGVILCRWFVNSYPHMEVWGRRSPVEGIVYLKDKYDSIKCDVTFVSIDDSRTFEFLRHVFKTVRFCSL